MVRFLTQDDPVQSPTATTLIERRLTQSNPGFVSVVEIVWVLERSYDCGPAEIVQAVERLLQTDVLVIEHEPEVFTAMIAVENRGGAFADALSGALGVGAGCSRTLTFDRKAARLAGFELA